MIRHASSPFGVKKGTSNKGRQKKPRQKTPGKSVKLIPSAEEHVNEKLASLAWCPGQAGVDMQPLLNKGCLVNPRARFNPP